MAANPFSDPEFGADAAKGAKPASKKNPFSDPEFGKEPKRTWGEAAKDTGAAVMGGLAGLVKTGGDLYGLASGNMDNAASELGRNAQEYWSDAKSQALQTKIAQRKANIDAQESTLGKAWTAVKDTLTDPALAADTVAENVATMLPGAGVGRAVGAAKYARGFQAASEFGPASLAAREAIAKQAGKYATGAAIGTGAVQQGADVSGDIYGDLMKKTDAEWDASPDFQAALQRHGGDRQAAKSELANATARAAFLPTAGISVAANAIPGATYLERALVGAPLRTGAKEVGRFGAARGFARGVLGEGGQEFVEEGGGRLGANLAAQQQAMPGHDTWDGVGENAGMGFAGGALLGVGGGVHGAREAMAQKRAQDAAKGAEDGGTLGTPAADTPPADVPPGDGQAGPGGGLGAPTGAGADMAGMLAPANPLLEAMNQRAADPSAIAPPIDDGKIFDKSAAAPVAGELYQPGDTTNPLTGERITAKPSEAMGINPADGPLSTGAALAVDTGVSEQMQQAAALAEAVKAAPKTPAGEAKTAAPDLSGWSDQQLSDTFRAAQAPDVRRQLAVELSRRRDVREQQALRQEMDAEQAAMDMQDAPDDAFANVREDAGAPNLQDGPSHSVADGVADKGRQPTVSQQPKEASSGTQAQETQQAGAGQQEARAGQAGARDESHLNALELRLSHERGRLRAAKTDAERATRQVTVDGIEREIAGERKFLGLAPQAASAMSDDALMQALKPDGAEKTSTAHLGRAPAAIPKQDVIYHMGDAAIVTGPAKDGLEPILWIEGARAGKEGVRPTKEARDARSQQNQNEWRDQQAQFRRLHESQQEAQTPIEPSAQAVPANPKAIERVNAGRAFFFSEPKAQDFIAKNGLADTHEVVQENRAFHVRAKDAKVQEPGATTVDAQLTQEAPSEPVTPAKPAPSQAGDAGAAHAAPEFTTIKTVHGDSVTVRTSDLQGDAPRLRQYTKAGKAKAVPAIHRDNLDLTGEKSAERAKENAKNPLFHTVTTKDGGAFASQAAAQREVNRLGLQDSHEVVEAGGGFVGRIKKTGEQHGATARNLRLADERTPGAGAAAPHGPGESVAGEAPVVGAGQRQTGDAGRLDGATTEQPVSSLFTGKPDPINSAPLRELDGFKVGDAVDVPGRTIGRSTIEVLFTSDVNLLPMNVARIVSADGKRLDVVTSELAPVDSVAAVAAAANEAATSPENDLPEPTDAQKAAGNYKMGHLSGDAVQGLNITIENPKGSTRSGKDSDGETWQNTMAAHYGYVKGSEAADGDHVDIFVGPDAATAPTVWVVDQVNPDGTYDEAKALFGFNTENEAVAAYKGSYDKGWKVGPITALSVDEFKVALADGRLKKPLNAALRQQKKAPAEDQAMTGLRRQLREVEDKIMAAAPASMAKGGGDIEAAMKSRAVPVTLKAQRKKLKDQIQQAQSADGSQSNQPQAQTQQAQAATENVAPDAEQSPVTAINKKQSEAEKALLRLAGLKGSKLISDDGRGRKLFEVKVTPEFRNRHFVNGLMPMVDGLELKEKSAVTGNVYDDGYILIDNREQLASRRAAAPNSGVEAQAQETTYNGTRIYPTKIKVGDEVKSMWAVESPDNQRRRAAGERTIGGDSLHDTIEQAKAAAEREAKRDAEQQAAKAEQDAADKARRDAEEARKAANRPKSVVERRKDAILDGPSKIGQGTKRAVITTAVDNGYVIEAKMVYDHAAKKRDQEAVDRASRAGYILGVSNENLPLVKAGNEAKARLKEGKYEKPEYRVYQGSDTTAPFREITKTEYDYAQELKAQRAAAPQAEAAQPATPQRGGNDFLPEGWTKSVNGFTKRPVYRMEQGVGQPFAVVTQTDGMTYEVQIRHGDKQLTTGAQRGALSEVLAAAEAELGRMTQADSVTHADPGEKAEAATPAVVTDSLKKAASNEDTKPSEMRKWLVAEIDKELLQAPDRADYDEAVKLLGEKDAISMFTGNGPLGKNSETGFITFDVPGDGKYKVRNSVRGLLEFRKNVMASSGFKDSGQKQVKPAQNDGVQGGSSGSMAAINNMIEEGDFEAARDYAEAVGIKLEDVKVPRGDMKPAWEKYLKDGTLPPAPDTRPQPAPKTAAQQDEEKRQAAEAEAKKPKDTGWNMAGTGYGGKRYIGRNITLDDGREVVARVYENAGTYEEAEVKVDGVRKFAVTDRENAQDKADAFIKTLTSKDGDASAPVAEPPAPAGRTYLAIPFNEKDYAKRAGAKWDEGKKLWYADPVGGDGAAAGEININLKQYVPQDSTKDDRYNYYGDKALATAVALNASARDGVQYDTIKRKHPDGIMMWSVVKAGEQTQAAPAAQPSIPAGYKPAGEPFYRNGKQIQGYAPFAPGERVTMKESAGQSGVVENLTSPDDAGVFSGAMVKFDNGSTQIVKFDKLDAEAKAAPATGTRRDPTKVSMFHPYEDGDIVAIDGQDWTVKQDTPGWYLTTTGNWRGQHPTIRNVKAMADLIREVEQAAEAKPASAGRTYQSAYDAEVERMHELADKKGVPASGINDDLSASLASLTIGRGFNQSPDEFLSANPAQKGRRDAMVAWRNGQIDHKPGQSEWAKRREKAQPAAESDTPKLTQSEAKELMEWQDLGQKDGIKTHILTFYESKADKDAKRGRMIVAKVTKGDRSASNWMVDGDDKPLAVLGMAKKRAEEIGMAKAVADGFVAEDNPFAEYNALAKQYGYEVRPDGAIGSDGKFPGPTMKVKGGRLRIESGSGNLLASYASPAPQSLGKFLESFWYAQKKAPVDGAGKTAEPASDRDHFTLERLNRETDRMEPVTFQRGETVKIAAGKRPYPTGVITGISHAERKFRVDGNEYGHDFGYAYKVDFDELARPRQEVDDSLNTLEQRLNEGNAIQSEGFIRSAKEVIERNNLGDYAKDRMAQLARRAADVSKSVLDKMRAAKAEKEQADAQKRAEDQAKVAEPKPPIEMTMGEWKAVSKDFKGMIDGKRTVMREGGMRFVTIIPSKAADSKTPTVDAHDALMASVREGMATPEQFKSGFEAVVAGKEAIKAELSAKTKAQLLEVGGPQVQWRHANSTKPDIVDAVYHEMLRDYALGETITHGLARDSYQNAVRRLVEATDADKLAQFVKEREAALEESKTRREATAKAMENPQTLDDFRAVISSHMEKHGDSMRDAYLRLTPEQRARYDDLEAEGTKARREQAKAAAKAAVAAAGQATVGEVIATRHTKLGHDLFVVQLAERVSREDYDTLNASARRIGGNYSSYRGNGAVPGFQFRTREAAEAFQKLVTGDAADAQALAEARRDAFEDDRSQSAVERLRAMAAALNERADEQLGRERKTNTARRARFAASAEGAALADKALAGTMNNLAAAIEAGTTKFLDAVRQKVQVEMLGQYLRSAKDAQIRAKYPSYGDQQKHRGEPVDAETVDYAEFPTYVAMRSDLASIARQMLEVDGLKQLGQRLMSVADDVSEAYTAWAKDNLLSVSRFGRGDQLAEFASREDAQRAIRRSGLTGRAIVLPIKRGQNRIVLAPSEAMKLGLWSGDGDKRITLSSDFGRELVQAVGRRAGGQIKLPWTLEAALERRKRLEGMGIFTAPEFRSALREFAGLQQAIATPDKIKEMERAMIGRANDGLDFFPTSPDVVQSMLDAAEIQDGMAVLEPSAGMGHIADAIRKTAGVDPDVVELSGARRELLEAKGYNLVGNDFMAMTPRSGFTFGDVFRDANGDLGVMRGSGSMGSGRVGFQPLDASRQPDARNARWVNRDELTGVEHRGADSGYDRIIMNPPFSDGRDIQHVQHAYELLRPGGRIVALMGDGAFFQSNRRAEAFRAWLDERGATSERLPEGSFMDPSLPVNTSVNARMVVIDKPVAAQEGDANFGARQRAASGTPTDRAVMDMAREGKSAQDILRLIAGTSKSRFNRQVARLLLKTGITPEVVFADTDLGGGDGFKFKAKYSRAQDRVTLTGEAAGQAEQIVLHELIHAATLRALDRKGLASLQMRRLFEHVQKHGGLAGTYGMKNVGEFTSEAFTNPEFQRALRQIAAPPGGRIKAAWDGFVRILRSILGLPQSEHSALSQALELGVAVMREDMALRQRGVVARGRDAQAGIDQTHMDATNENAPTSDKSGAFAGLPQSGMQERAVRAVTGSPEPAQSGFEAGSGAKITTVPAGVVKSALERANKEAASLAEFDIQEELRSLQENGGGADLAEIAQNPEFWDAEDEVFTQAGLDEIDRINEQIARDRAGVSVAESLEDLNSAHHFAQALAFESILDGLGVPYEKDGRQSQYFTISDQNTGDNIIKFRFADHENTVRDSALGQHRILFNVAPGGRSFTDAVQRLIQVLNDQSAPETDGAFMGVNQTETPAFRRWFGDSKVVDANGKPLVVYHATDAKFSVFDFDKLGSVTDSNTGGDQTAIATSRIGFWFHERPLTAAHEMGSSVAMDVYLSLENPARLTQRDLWRVAENFNNDADAIRDYFTEGEFDGEDRDGLIIEDEEFGGTSFVAFYPEQIKSAIGNNGNFDPEDADIAHFGAAELRGLKDNALDRINTVMSHPGTVSLWDKTVGTMRHLAQRAPAFKPVFEAAQRFIDDVAMMANDAADMAPRVLPRVDTWRDLAKKPISAADNKAVAKPLFEGTLLWARDANDKPVLVSDLEKRYASLPAEDKAQMMLKLGKLDADVLRMWRGMEQDRFEALVNSRFENQMLKAGVVWSDKELADLFKATPSQISLYRETRKAIDRSIDMTARADMLRVLGEDFAGLRDAVLEQDSLGDAMEFLISELTERQRANPDDSRRLTELHNSIVDRAEKARDLMAKGYAPLSRFGRYTVDVVDARGERQYFGMYESKADSNRALMQLKAAFPGATVTQGTMSQEAYKLFAGITPESLELFGNMLGLDEEGGDARDKVFQEYLKLTKNNHSALKRLIHRQGIAGFSEDVGRVLAAFVYSNARQSAGALNAGTIDKAVNAIPKEQGELKDVAMGLRNYIRDPQEEGQAVRGMLFAQYLGGSVASAFVNMTQPFAVTMPWLSQYGGIKSAGAHLAKALKDMGTKGFKYEADLAAALKHAEDDGVVSPQEIHQLMAQARGSGSLRSGDGTKVGEARAAAANAWERTKVAWGQPFALAEQFNRRSTFIAAYRIAKEQKMADPAAFARRAVEETQFVYSKAAKSRWMRGAIGGTLMTFKSYSIQYLELLHRMWTQGGPEGKRAVGWAMVMLMLAGGAGGLPFMEDLEDLIDGIAQLMGYNVSSKQWRQRALRDVLGKELAEFMEQGVSGLPGAPVDVSGRLGLGNLIPGTGLLLQKPNRERDLLEVAGPAGDLFKRGFTGGRKLLAGDVGGAALEVSPTAVSNAVKGADMAASGMYKDAKGYKVIDTTLGEALAKAGGFQPRSLAQVQEANSFMMRSRSFYQQNSAEIKAQWADALFRKDEAALERVRERLAAWNRDNPEQPIVVKMPDVWKRVREMGKDRTQRIADTAPKALRQQMREMALENGRPV